MDFLVPGITVKTGGGEQRPGLVSQVAVQGGAQPQDVDGFLLGAVEEVVLDGARHRARPVLQLSHLEAGQEEYTLV